MNIQFLIPIFPEYEDAFRFRKDSDNQKIQKFQNLQDDIFPDFWKFTEFLVLCYDIVHNCHNNNRIENTDRLIYKYHLICKYSENF